MIWLDRASVMIAFEPIADLDPHPPLVGRDEQDRAIVRAFLADAPVAAESIAVILDLDSPRGWRR